LPIEETTAPKVRDTLKASLERELTAERSAHPAFSDGSMKVTFSDGPNVAFSDGPNVAFSDGPGAPSSGGRSDEPSA
jgi:hypothetical protein